MSSLYTENSIVTESPRLFTRRVPSTYLGSSKKNTNLVKEIFANAIDEHAIGHGDVIDVMIDLEKNEYVVEDHGQGFLVNAGIDEDGETVLQRSFDKLNTSGKTTADGVYNGTALGLNGIGAKLTNWLSKKLHVITYRDGQSEALWFKDGIFQKREIKKTKHDSGTIVTWNPDPQFFGENVPDDLALRQHFEIIAALCPGLTINYTYNGEKTVYSEPGGINSYVERKVKGKELFSNRFIVDRAIGKDRLNICITYTSEYSENIDAYVNLGHTDSGQHITAFHTAFTRAVNKYATEAGLFKKNDKNFSNAEISEGLYVVCNMTTTTAKYDAQNKSRIDDIDAKIINSVVGGDFATWLLNNPADAKIIVDKALTARKAREAAKKAKEKIRDASKVSKKTLFADLPSKLVDCYPKKKNDRSNCELMICLKGDTRIKLLNGTNPTIESLVGQTDIWAYSTNENGAMIPAQIKSVFKTQEVNRMIKLTFDDGSIVECTPEHRFLDRDTCTWVEAKDLVIGQSMFSMKFKTDNSGHLNVFIPGGANNYIAKSQNVDKKYYKGIWESVHIRTAKYLGISHDFDGTYMDIHHKDLNKTNNDPSNLQYITKKEHLAIHNKINHDSGRMKYENKHFTEESRKNMQTAVYRRSKEGIDHQRDAVSKAWKDGKYKNATWTNNFNSTKRFIDGKDTTMMNKISKTVKEMLDKNIEITRESYNNYVRANKHSYALYDRAIEIFGSHEALIENGLNYNIKVVNIEYVDYEEAIPVYCLNIDNEFHSFVLDNGLISHNCEGDSASGLLIAMRDAMVTAVMPIRGKIISALKATPDKIYANQEVSSIVKALGLDIDKVTGKLIYDINKLRYHKIIITSDSDADGDQIANLIITLLYWLCPELIINGHVYRVHGALFNIQFADGKHMLFYTNKEFDAWRKKNPNKRYTVTRAKGLGEMTEDETYEQLLNPATRNLHKLTTDNFEDFTYWLEVFQGGDPSLRQEFIEKVDSGEIVLNYNI